MRDNEPLLFDGIDAMITSLPPTGWRLNMITNSPPHVLNEQQFPLVPGDSVADAEAMYYNTNTGSY